MRAKKLAAALVGAVMLAAALTSCAEGSSKVRIGTAGSGGTYYAYGTVLSEIFGQTMPDTSFEVRTTTGSAANLRLLSDDHLELAITQSDVTDEAYHGTGMFDGTPRTGYSAVASLYTEACQIVVRADSDLHSVDDLLGKVVSVGEKESGVLYNAEAILDCCGLSFDMIQVRNLSYADAALALGDGTIDAFFCTAGAPTNAVANLARETPVRLLSLDQHQMDRLLTAYGACIPTTVPANTYPGQTEDTVTVGVRAMLLASDSMSQDQIYSLISALYENSNTIQMGTAANTKLVLEEAAAGITIPCHPGAAQFFQEHNIAIEEEA